MNKSVKKVGCLLLSALTVFSLAACGGETGDGIDETGISATRPIVFSTEALDGNFNPFFATSAADVNIVGMTQIGMLSVDAEGDVACGQDEPTVVESYTVTEAEDKSYTDYRMVIKKGIKFSNGTELTIKDVLFNLYVYLDPAYSGSATIYSTDIVGLDAYRQQDPSLLNSGSSSSSNFNQQFEDEASTRITNLVSYLEDKDAEFSETEIEVIEGDITRLKELFSEEVKSDWTNNAGSQESYKAEYTFTENWEIYLYVEGIDSVYYPANSSKPLKTTDGKYITKLTKPGSVMVDDGTETGTLYDGTWGGETIYADHIVGEIEEAAENEALISEKMSAQDCTREEAIEYVIQDTAIAIVYDAYTAQSTLADIAKYWASGEDLREEIVAEARTTYFENLLGTGGLKVKSIAGITTDKTKAGNDVLCIRINGIDPKAIWNFGFTVAPMYYYSNEDAINKNTSVYPNVTEFGVVYNNSEFMQKVVGDAEKSGLPVGAGVYKATNKEDKGTVDKNNFYRNNIVYFVRNDNFGSVGSGLHRAKIKYLRYQVINSDQIINAISTGEIDIGEPNATAANIEAIDTAGLYKKVAPTNGYGYVGINAKEVPDIEVRRAIMYAMDITDTLSYYTASFAQPVYRSMSRESWAYPNSATLYYDLYADTAEYNQNNGTNYSEKEFILNMLSEAGWTLNSNNKLQKDGKILELTFTIAGGTTDHPAYMMFNNAERWLEDWGFTITVQNDISALAKLADGKLAVWAAAWSSTVDPDMYQIYHMDSTASSVKNWGYPTIKADTTGQYTEEYDILTKLSERIDAARETTVLAKRAEIYAEALDLVMELAVELPTYQRNDCVCYNPNLIDGSTLNQDPTAFAGVINRIWELDYKKA